MGAPRLTTSPSSGSGQLASVFFVSPFCGAAACVEAADSEREERDEKGDPFHAVTTPEFGIPAFLNWNSSIFEAK
ncbi:hypothetical protein [Pyrinomonas sp.]|uniref:hypothetical protein n=1 Tax=Pyrinomonas sp. TaxID=2080306 RepID=UPI003319CAE0